MAKFHIAVLHAAQTRISGGCKRLDVCVRVDKQQFFESTVPVQFIPYRAGSLLDGPYHTVCRCLKFCREQKNFLEQLGCDRTLVEMMRAGNLYENAVQALAVQRATGLAVGGAKAPQGKDTEVSHSMQWSLNGLFPWGVGGGCQV